MEFEQFYPKLKAYLGYKLQPIVHTMNEIDSMSYNGIAATVTTLTPHTRPRRPRARASRWY